MSRITEYKTARSQLERASGDLTDKAQQYVDRNRAGWALKELLAAGREYGRAFSRVEKMRSSK